MKIKAVIDAKSIVVRQLFFQEKGIEKDIFRLLFISSGVYVSERLKNAFQENGITGCRFVAIEDLANPALR